MTHFQPSRPRLQQGSALIVAIFMLVVVALLGAFAIRIGMNQQQSSSLALIEARARTAAFSALEYGSYVVRTGGMAACANVPQPVPIPAQATTIRNNFSVQWQCSGASNPGIGTVYTITGMASIGTYGHPDYVRRTLVRRVSDIPLPGYW